VIKINGDQSYTVELSHHKRIMMPLEKMKATCIASALEEIVELHFATKNEAEQMALTRVHKIMDNQEGPHGMEVLFEWMGKTPNESTWVELQKLGGVPHWRGEFFAV